MQSLKIFLVLSFGLFMGSCAEGDAGVNAGSEQSRDPSPAHFIKISKGACFGTCPVFDLTLYGDGRAVFYGARHTKLSGQHKSRLSVGRFLEGQSFLREYGFRAMRERYDRSVCKYAATDHPSVEIEVRTGDFSKSVYWYTGCRRFEERASLARLIDELERIMEAERFIGTDAERRAMKSGL